MKPAFILCLALFCNVNAFAAKELSEGERILKFYEDLGTAPDRMKKQTAELLKVGAGCVENFDELAKRVPEIQKDFEAATVEARKVLEPILKDAKTDIDHLRMLRDAEDCKAKLDPLIEELYEKSLRLQAIELKMETLEKKMYKARNAFQTTFIPEGAIATLKLKLKPASCPSDYRAAYEKAYASEESEKKLKESSAFYTAMDDIWLSKGAAHDLSGVLYSFHSELHDLSCTCGRPSGKKCETAEEREERNSSVPSSSGN